MRHHHANWCQGELKLLVLRPAAAVPFGCLGAATPAGRPRYIVLLPITHTHPTGDTVGIEISRRVKLASDLDDTPNWVIVSEHRINEWPNANVSTLRGLADELNFYRAAVAKLLRMHAVLSTQIHQTDHRGSVDHCADDGLPAV